MNLHVEGSEPPEAPEQFAPNWPPTWGRLTASEAVHSAFALVERWRGMARDLGPRSVTGAARLEAVHLLTARTAWTPWGLRHLRDHLQAESKADPTGVRGHTLQGCAMELTWILEDLALEDLDNEADHQDPVAYVRRITGEPLRPPASEVVLELDRLTRDRDVQDLPLGFLLRLTDMADRMAGLELYLPSEEEVDELLDLAEVAP